MASRERADAARNRAAIMAAAEELLRVHEPAEVSIERIAAAAGVGKATVFHRFGSRAELMQALAHSRADSLRVAVQDGPPPLGPGAPAAERLIAFLDAIMDHASRSIGLLTAAEHATLTSKAAAAGAVREDHPVRVFWLGHIAGLLARLRPDLDAELAAHLILGSLHDPLIIRLLRDGETDRVRRALHQLATALIAPV